MWNRQLKEYIKTFLQNNFPPQVVMFLVMMMFAGVFWGFIEVNITNSNTMTFRRFWRICIRLSFSGSWMTLGPKSWTWVGRWDCCICFWCNRFWYRRFCFVFTSSFQPTSNRWRLECWPRCPSSSSPARSRTRSATSTSSSSACSPTSQDFLATAFLRSLFHTSCHCQQQQQLFDFLLTIWYHPKF